MSGKTPLNESAETLLTLAPVLVVAIVLAVMLSVPVGPRTALEPLCEAASGNTASADAGKVRVVVSILPQAYFVERIGGDRVDVSVMVPPGASPHTYEPTASQMRDLARARMYVRIRVHFEEAWMPRISAANKNMLIVDSTSGIALSRDEDPHVWLSPRLVRVQAEHICRGLVKIDPAGREVYEHNKAAFLRELDALDEELARVLAPVRGRRFMVLHPAWGYFARDYGLQELPIEVEGKEPSAKELAALVETARANHVKVVFVQPQMSPRTAEVLARQIGARVVTLDPLARDWAANLRTVAQTLAEVLGAGSADGHTDAHLATGLPQGMVTL
ncbi:MAG: zinc transport system substrate-binding protein [Bacillota bacterium]|nr:zinc ABC transporter substrate-binding protein [Bacillota bacterium]MDK2932062.1 zinc transport system substrate-binding protein [Bacillota bacterium]